VVALVGSVRLHSCAPHTKRFIMAINYEDDDTYRYLLALDPIWHTLDSVQSHTLRWLVEVFAFSRSKNI